MQKDSKEPAPEFYNIYLERPKVFSLVQLYMIDSSCSLYFNKICIMYLLIIGCLQGDADGYDLVVVDAMHKANYASRICHSCRPNCEAKLVFSLFLYSTFMCSFHFLTLQGPLSLYCLTWYSFSNCLSQLFVLVFSDE